MAQPQLLRGEQAVDGVAEAEGAGRERPDEGRGARALARVLVEVRDVGVVGALNGFALEAWGERAHAKSRALEA
eukprot:14560595-Alexandrium_andersonii.AAC.1